jgi:hypothetical protein
MDLQLIPAPHYTTKKKVSNVLPQEYITSLHTLDHVPSMLTMSVTLSSYHGHVIGDFPTMPSTIPIDLQELPSTHFQQEELQ